MGRQQRPQGKDSDMPKTRSKQGLRQREQEKDPTPWSLKVTDSMCQRLPYPENQGKYRG